MIILSIDTSQSASVALVDTATDTVIAAEQADDQRRHVEFIGPALARVLASDPQPELVIVGIGPGPFTGLRVGIAAGIAVGQARKIPVRGLLSQAAIAEELVRTGAGRASDGGSGAHESGLPALIASDARRKEVYFSVYDSADASLIAGPFVAKPAEVATVLADNGYQFDHDRGTQYGGAQDQNSSAPDQLSLPALTRIGEKLGRGFVLYPDTLGEPTVEGITDPRAEYLALAAARELTAGRELREPIPEYLREPDAKATPVRESSLK
jgi:tRNA threonylcarbamoyladenosine biosynthesis protein TsaB